MTQHPHRNTAEFRELTDPEHLTFREYTLCHNVRVKGHFNPPSVDTTPFPTQITGAWNSFSAPLHSTRLPFPKQDGQRRETGLSANVERSSRPRSPFAYTTSHAGRSARPHCDSSPPRLSTTHGNQGNNKQPGPGLP